MKKARWWFVGTSGELIEEQELTCGEAARFRRYIRTTPSFIQVFEFPSETIVCHQSFGERTYPDLDIAKAAILLHLKDLSEKKET